MHTYGCTRCGEEVTINDGHRCDPMAGLDEDTDYKRQDARRHTGMTKDERLDDPRHVVR